LAQRPVGVILLGILTPKNNPARLGEQLHIENSKPALDPPQCAVVKGTPGLVRVGVETLVSLGGGC
jgi:hypothetical protein